MQLIRQQQLAAGRCTALPSSVHRCSRPITVVRSSANDWKGKDEDFIWSQLAFPSYLQSRETHKKDVCRDFDKAVKAAERKQSNILGSFSEDEGGDELDEEESVWLSIRREAERDAAAEPLLSSFLYATILAHDSFERALAFVLSNRLANAVMLPTQLFETFYEVLVSEPDVRQGALADVEACRERDPACTSYSQALLYYKGYHAIQTHRIAHALWSRGQRVMAVALQSRMSEVLAVDIHPAARLGHGILLDHGTGVVIGETAVIGNNVSLLQNVTLGGTGKEHGDRHPKISDNVLIGASATVLGNIRVGEGAQIAAGSLVLKPVAPHTMVAGSPAKPVGTITGNPAETMQQWSKKLLNYDPFCDPETAANPVDTAAAPPAAPTPKAKKARPGPADVAASEAAWDAFAAQTTLDDPGLAGLTGSSSSSSSNGSSSGISAPPSANMHVHVNGHSHPAASNGAGSKPATAGSAKKEHGKDAAGSSSSSSSSSTSASAAQQEQHSQQQQWHQADAQQYMYEQVTGHHLQPVSEPQQPQEQEQEQQQAAPASPATAAAAAAAAVEAPAAAAAVEQQQGGAADVSGLARRQGAEVRGIHGGEVEATIDEAVAAEKWSGRKEEPEYVI